MRRDWIDLNGDIGESDAGQCVGDDAALVPLLSSASIACGGHAGDEASMARCIALCRRHGVAIGAHPSFPDREGFGRRHMALEDDDLDGCLRTQIEALARLARAAGACLAHVKPHGALYNIAAAQPRVARVVARAVRSVDPSLVLVGLAGSRLLEAGLEAGLRVRAEGFADRRYAADGTLLPRSDPRALIVDTEEAVAQVLGLLAGEVVAVDGTLRAMAVETVCVHGDGTHALELAAALRQRLLAAGIVVRAGG
jgi:UPF0271 protein